MITISIYQKSNFQFAILQILLFFVVLGTWHCKKIETSVTTLIDISGVIENDYQTPLAGAKVTIDQMSTETNASGYFSLKGVHTSEKPVLLKASHPNFFNGFRLVYTGDAKHYSVRIKLLNQHYAEVFDSKTAFSTTLDGVKLDFPANALVDASGITYSGTCRVFGKCIKADNSDIASLVPGGMLARDRNGDQRSLATYGMAAVVLETPAGLPLQVAPGKTVQMSIPIADNFISNAPENIPLWHFDENEGIWIEEGSAAKMGDYYVGEVAHFSFWNCDLPFPTINISGTITQNGAGAQSTTLTFKLAENSLFCGSTYLSDGYFDGAIPAGMPIIMEVADLCGNVKYTQTIGPFSENIDLGDIAVPSIQLHSIKAKLVDCNGTPVPYGFLSGSINNGGISQPVYLLFADENGIIAGQTSCPIDQSLEICFYSPTMSSASAYFTIVPAGEVTDLGEIIVCQDEKEFFEVSQSGLPLGSYFYDTQATVNGDTTTIIAIDSFSIPIFYLRVANSGQTGTFSAVDKFEVFSNLAVNTAANPENINITVNLEKWGNAPGLPVSGTFVGGIKTTLGLTSSFSGKFYALRQE